uniref:Uncharacterized protein n=1 Tax=Phlebotomus papatasi TaxID=29031 RepID=A0A1B0DFE5_PHLPP
MDRSTCLSKELYRQFSCSVVKMPFFIPINCAAIYQRRIQTDSRSEGISNRTEAKNYMKTLSTAVDEESENL